MICEHLPKTLIIEDKMLKNCLMSIEIALTNNIWVERTLLGHYTNHGIDHTKRIIEHLGSLLNSDHKLLNEHEKFILLASAYLHDIGMESPKHCDLPNKESYSMKELEKVREKHHIASAKMILESIKPESKLELGLKEEVCKKYARSIAEIVKYHRELSLGDEKLKDTAYGSKSIRIRLLAALLRLSDCLDGDERRVRMNHLVIREIPTLSKFHWWGHHYVQSIRVEKGIIRLIFRFPELFNKREDIKEIFKEKIIEDIKKTLADTYDILFNEISLHYEPRVEDEIFAPAGELVEIPKDLTEHINEVLETKQLEKKSVKEGIKYFFGLLPYSDDEELVKHLKLLFYYIREENYKKALTEIEQLKLLTTTPGDKMIILTNGGIVYYVTGNLDKAKEYFEDAIKISQKVVIKKLYGKLGLLTSAICKGNLGLVYQRKGKLAKALEHHENALDLSREIGDKEGEANQLGNMGNVYRTRGELEKALKHFERALNIYREIGDKEGEANQLGNMGLIYQTKGELEKALKHFERALTFHKEIGNKRGEASDLGNIGLINRTRGKLGKALEFFENALNIYKEIGDKEGEAATLGNVSGVYQAQGKLKMAQEHLKDTLNICREIGYKEGEASALANIGSIYYHQEKIELALEQFKNALNLHREIGNKEGEAIILGNISAIYQEWEKLDIALEYLEDALKYHREIGNKEGEASLLGDFGLICQKQGKLDAALEYHEKALLISRTIGCKKGEATAYGDIGSIYRKQGKLDAALDKLEKALNISESVYLLITNSITLEIARIYFAKDNYKKGFSNCGKALSYSYSKKQIELSLDLIFNIVKKLSVKNDWENLEQIKQTYFSQSINIEWLTNLLQTINEYAHYKKTGRKEARIQYLKSRKDLSKNGKDFLDKFLKNVLEE